MKMTDKYIGIGGAVLLAASPVLYSITNIWNWLNWILLVLGLAGSGYFLYQYYTKRDKNLSKRALKEGANVAVQVVVTLLIVGMLAFISTRQHLRKDLTKNNLYSLSSQTTKLLEGLNTEVKIYGFYKNSDQAGPKDLLDEYQYRSSKLTYTMIDPDEQPEMTKKYHIGKYGTVIVEANGKRESVDKLSEADLTNAIIKVTRTRDKVIYFTTGHGERSIKDESAAGFKMASEAIKNENYLVKEINLVRDSIPDDCSILAVISPKSQFMPGELDTISAYLNEGGKLLLMVDPDHNRDIADFIAKYHVELGNDMVIDASGVGRLFGAGPGMPLVTTYDQSHPITKGFNIMSFYPYASSLTPAAERAGFTIKSILKTSDNSWAETKYASGKVEFNPNEDKKGPVTLAVVVEKKLDSGKEILAIFGDSDFASNGYFKNQGNSNLFLNTVNYLAEDEDAISIRPKELDDSRLTLTNADVKVLFYLVVIIIPLLVVIIGVVIYFKRNRG
jgi:ABC-type uncharacterized transport system involved in gliding motility auxiliary subunit